METLELLAHPVRLRIVHAMRGGRELTTADLCHLIPDPSQAMVYRHVEQLASAGVLEVAEERRVRGAVERRYRLIQEHLVADPETLAALSPADHQRLFAASMAILIAEFNACVVRENADPLGDLISYRQHTLWLSPAEAEKLIHDLRAVIYALRANEPTPDRGRYLLSPILFPVEQPEEQDPDAE